MFFSLVNKINSEIFIPALETCSHKNKTIKLIYYFQIRILKSSNRPIVYNN